MTLVTDYYRKVLETEHSLGEWGVASTYQAETVYKLMRKWNQTELLDYGAGVGNLYKTLVKFNPNVVVHHYEPGIEKWNVIPQPCNMVVCIDVIEHIEPECLDAVLLDLVRVTKKFAFITICTIEAQRVLNNGWNAHINIKTAAEWQNIFSQHFNILKSNIYESGIELWLHAKE